MKNVTREGDANKYYIYKDFFITRQRHNGMYSCYANTGICLISDTQRGMKSLVNNAIENEKA